MAVILDYNPEKTRMITQQVITESKPYPITGSYGLRTWVLKSIPPNAPEFIISDDEELEQHLVLRLVGQSAGIAVKQTDLTHKLQEQIVLDETVLLKHRVELFNDRYNRERMRKNLFDRCADYTFNQLSSLLCTIDFLNCDVEITPTEVIKFTLKLADNKILMVSKSYQYREENGDSVIVFSVFNNRELLVSNAAEITELPEGISKYLAL